MKINQVAELVDITKKNIRFYEDQGLLKPERNPENGYRDYTMENVKQLSRVKLLRQLGVSCEDIRKLRTNDLSFEDCVNKRRNELIEASESIEHMRTICEMLAEEGEVFSTLDASKYLEKMKNLEKGGVRFMNVKSSDVRRRKNGAIIAAAVTVIFMIAMIALILWVDSIDPAPKGMLLLMVVLFGSIIAGVLMALSQRIKELNGGEYDEASKY